MARPLLRLLDLQLRICPSAVLSASLERRVLWAANQLQGHHGSRIPARVQAWLEAMPKPGRRRGNQQRRKDDSAASRSADAWCCKMCTGADGAAFRNFGDRKACHKCGIAKGACFLRKADAPSGSSPSTSMAERQARQRLQAKDSEISKLKQELQALRRPPSAEAEAPEASTPAPDGGQLDLLKKQLAFKEDCLRAAKSASLDEDAAAVEAQISQLRADIAKAKSPETQHEVAHRKIKKAKRDLEKLQEDVAKATEAQSAAARALAESQAALQEKEQQIVELQAAFSATAKAALPPSGPSEMPCDFTISEHELDGKPELKAFCSDARFSEAMDILRARAQLAQPPQQQPPQQLQQQRQQQRQGQQEAELEDMELEEGELDSLLESFEGRTAESSPATDAADERRLELKRRFAAVAKGIVRKRLKPKASGG